MKKFLVLVGILFLALLPLENAAVQAVSYGPLKCGEKYNHALKTYICEKEPNNRSDQANPLILNESYLASLGKDDADFYKATVKEKGHLEIYYSYPKELKIGLKLFDGKNNLVEPIDYIEPEEDGNTAAMIYDVDPGIYYLRFVDEQNTGQNYIYIFTPFMESEKKDNAEPEMDDIAPNKPKVQTVDDNDTVIKGTAEPNTLLMAEVDGVYIAEDVVVSENGTFSFKIKPLPAGTKVKVWIQDAYGNPSDVTTVTVIDKTPPKTLVVNTITTKSKTVTGKTEPGATVEVKLGAKLLGKTTADSKGSFKVTIKAQKKGAKLTINAIDKAKNKKTVTVVVK
ncbi:Ig-like domain-containing protein [Pseudoneobacillus sp. C159]